MKPYALAVDLGATNMRAALVSSRGRVNEGLPATSYGVSIPLLSFLAYAGIQTRGHGSPIRPGPCESGDRGWQDKSTAELRGIDPNED